MSYRQADELYVEVLPAHDDFLARRKDLLDPGAPGGHALDNAFVAVVRQCPAFAPLQEPQDIPEYELGQYLKLLTTKRDLYRNEWSWYDGFNQALYDLFHPLNGHDKLFVAEPSPFSMEFMQLVPARRLVEGLYDTVFRNPQFFPDLYEQMKENALEANGVRSFEDKRYKTIRAIDLPDDELVRAYTKGTPFYDVFSAPIPLAIPYKTRFEHTHILGGSGAGKTTLLENLIVDTIRDPRKPSVVVIDPHSQLIRKLIHADLGITDRLVLIDPRDIDHPPALNIFAKNRRLEGYDAYTREQVQNGVLETFDYLFTGLTDLSLTGKQETFFQYIARLMLSAPEALGRNATIADMLALMDEKKGLGAFAKVIASLPTGQRDFFENDFIRKEYNDTKGQIRYRLRGITGNETMDRILNSPDTKVDFFSELNRGAVILIDTADDFLKSGSALLGRFMLSQVFQAIMERAALSEGELRDTFIFVDEANDVMDAKTADMLRAVRKYRCGMCLCHQDMSKASSDLRAALSGSTSIKFAAKPASQDARVIAADLRTTADFILNQRQYHWAAYVSGTTPQAVSVSLKPVGDLPQLSPSAYELWLQKNQERVSTASDDIVYEMPDERPHPGAERECDDE